MVMAITARGWGGGVGSVSSWVGSSRGLGQVGDGSGVRVRVGSTLCQVGWCHVRGWVESRTGQARIRGQLCVKLGGVRSGSGSSWTSLAALLCFALQCINQNVHGNQSDTKLNIANTKLLNPSAQQKITKDGQSWLPRVGLRAATMFFFPSS